MWNNLTGGSINHGNGWITTHDPRGDIRHYVGQPRNNDFANNILNIHNDIQQQMNMQAREQREAAKREISERQAREKEEARRRHEEEEKRRKEEEAKPFHKKLGHDKRFSTDFPRNFKLDNPYRKTLNAEIQRHNQTKDSVSNSRHDLTKELEKAKELLVKAKLEKAEADRNVQEVYRIERQQTDISSSGYFTWAESHEINDFEERIAFRDSIGRNKSWEDVRQKLIDNEMARRKEYAARDKVIFFENHVKKLSEHLDSIINEEKSKFSETLTNAHNVQEYTLDDSLISKMNRLAPSAMGSRHVPQALNPTNEIAYKAGQLAALPVAAAEMVEGLANIVIHPIDTANSLYQFAKNDNKLEIVDNALEAKLDLIKREEDKGTLVGSFKAGLEKNKLVIDSVSLAMGGVGLVEAGTSAIVKGAKIANEGAGLATKAEMLLIDAQKANKTVNLEDKYPIVRLKDTKIKWGYPIGDQGLPWETFIEPSLPPNSRLPKNFNAFDFFDRASNTAISAKTLNTTTAAKIADPREVFTAIKDHIHKAKDFQQYSLKGVELKASMIDKRELWLAVPAKTTKEQWLEIEKGIEYAEMNNIEVKVTRVKE